MTLCSLSCCGLRSTAPRNKGTSRVGVGCLPHQVWPPCRWSCVVRGSCVYRHTLGIAPLLLYYTCCWTHRLSSPHLQLARQTLQDLTSLLSAAAAALDSFDEDRMHAVLADADRLDVSLECEGQIRRLLAMPPRPRLQLRLKKALASGDVEAVANTTVQIKRLFFAENDGMFNLDSYPGLRPMSELIRVRLLCLQVASLGVQGFLCLFSVDRARVRHHWALRKPMTGYDACR